jgi:hypothetical protein
MKNFKTMGDGTAAVQWDVITHSMGGNIALTIASSPPGVLYARTTNYNAGDFHKLISLDTPYLGSEFAARLEQLQNIACKEALDLIGLTVGDAVQDLAPGNKSLTPSGVLPYRAHVIASSADDGQEQYASLTWAALPVGPLCPGFMPASGLPAVFNGVPNDLIVSVNSQEATGFGVPSDLESDTIHTILPLFLGPDVLSRNIDNIGNYIGVSTPVPQKVIDLLNAWIDSGSFGLMVPPSTQPN